MISHYTYMNVIHKSILGLSGKGRQSVKAPKTVMFFVTMGPYESEKFKTPVLQLRFFLNLLQFFVNQTFLNVSHDCPKRLPCFYCCSNFSF